MKPRKRKREREGERERDNYSLVYGRSLWYEILCNQPCLAPSRCLPLAHSTSKRNYYRRTLISPVSHVFSSYSWIGSQLHPELVASILGEIRGREYVGASFHFNRYEASLRPITTAHSPLIPALPQARIPAHTASPPVPIPLYSSTRPLQASMPCKYAVQDGLAPRLREHPDCAFVVLHPLLYFVCLRFISSFCASVHGLSRPRLRPLL